MYAYPFLPPQKPMHYRMRTAGGKKWEPADDMVLSAHPWLTGWVLSLDWIAAQRITDSQLIKGTDWQIETARGVSEYRSARVEWLPLARVVTVRLRAA
jgi:hypothetical protein